MNLVSSDEGVSSRTTGEDESVFAKLCQDKFYQYQKLTERKVWYSNAAAAYNSYRPKYPKQIIQEAVKHISGNRILEIGSGPGTASVPLAELGYELRCIEPNASFCDVCRKNTKQFPKVKVETSSFEEAVIKPASYDAVVAATSIHWIPFETAFPKCAAALKPRGKLVLLWNMTMIPTHAAVMERMIDLHSDLPEDCDLKNTIQYFWELGGDHVKLASDVESHLTQTDLFEDFHTETTHSQATYTAEEFVGVLSTYSPYIRLTEEVRANLFQRLVSAINKEMEGKIELTFHSVYNIATKK